MQKLISSVHSISRQLIGLTKKEVSIIRLPRLLSVPETTAYITCMIIGSGIFVSPRGVLGHTVSPGMAMAVWLVTGLVNIPQSLCYAELALTFPKVGSDYTYLREGLGSLPAFLYIWVEVVFRNGVGKAIGALTFSAYFCKMFFHDCSSPETLRRLVSVLAVAAVTAAQCRSTRFAVGTSSFLAAAKVIGVLLVIACGMIMIDSEFDLAKTLSLEGSPADPGSYVLAYYTANWAYAGLGHCMNIVEEIKPPLKRSILTSIVVSHLFILALYLLANLSYFIVLSPAEILSSDAVAMNLAGRVFHGLFWLIPFFVSCSTFGNLNNGIMCTARLILAASRERHLPRLLSLLSAERLTPVPALGLTLATTVLFLCTSELYTLILYTSYTSGLSAFLSLCGLVRLRWTRPELRRPFKLPLVVPVMSLLVWLVLLALPIYSDPVSTGICFGFIATGVPAYYFMRWEGKPKVIRELDAGAMRMMQRCCYALPEEYVEE